LEQENNTVMNEKGQQGPYCTKLFTVPPIGWLVGWSASLSAGLLKVYDNLWVEI